MNKIFLATLILASSSAITMHNTLLTARETKSTINVSNTTIEPIETTYTRAQDNKAVVKELSGNEDFTIEQYEENPIKQMSIKAVKAPELFRKEIKSEEVLDLAKSSGTIFLLRPIKSRAYSTEEKPHEITYVISR